MCKSCQLNPAVISLRVGKSEGQFCVSCAIKQLEAIPQPPVEEIMEEWREKMLKSGPGLANKSVPTVPEPTADSQTFKEDLKVIQQTDATTESAPPGEFCIVLDCPDRPQHGFCLYAWYDKSGQLHCKKKEVGGGAV